MFLIVDIASRASSLSLAMLVLIVSAAMFALASVRYCVLKYTNNTFNINRCKHDAMD